MDWKHYEEMASDDAAPGTVLAEPSDEMTDAEPSRSLDVCDALRRWPRSLARYAGTGRLPWDSG